MQAQVREWGNSQGIRLSKDILKSAGIALNEMLEVTVSDGVITLAKTFRHKTLEERAAEYNGRLMLDGEYDFGEPVGREMWKEDCAWAGITPQTCERLSDVIK